MSNKRGQNQVYDDFMAIVKSFDAVKEGIEGQQRGGSLKLDSLL